MRLAAAASRQPAKAAAKLRAARANRPACRCATRPVSVCEPAAVTELALDATLRRRLAAAGHARVREEFTLGRMLDRYEDLLARVTRRD